MGWCHPGWWVSCGVGCWHTYPFVQALGNVLRPFSGCVATPGLILLPCSLLIASSLGLIAAATPSRAQPPVRLCCQIGHLAKVPRLRTRCTCTLHHLWGWLVSVTILVVTVFGGHLPPTYSLALPPTPPAVSR